MSPPLLPKPYAATRHFVERARERGLPRDVEGFVLAWGTEIESRDDCKYFTVLRRDLPDGLAWSSLARRADGWIVVVAENGSLITCYRERHAWRTLKRRREDRRHAA